MLTINKLCLKSTLKYLIFFGLNVFSANSFSMLCPTNFNNIDVGYTIQQVIQLCGAPDEQSEYKDTITLSGGTTGGQSYGSYYQSPTNYYSQSQGNYQQLNDVKEKVIIVTKFTYRFPQPSMLIFENGILKDKLFLH